MTKCQAYMLTPDRPMINACSASTHSPQTIVIRSTRRLFYHGSRTRLPFGYALFPMAGQVCGLLISQYKIHCDKEHCENPHN